MEAEREREREREREVERDSETARQRDRDTDRPAHRIDRQNRTVITRPEHLFFYCLQPSKVRGYTAVEAYSK